jgi:hypothetical protein
MPGWRQELTVSGADGREVLQKYTPALVDRYAEMAGHRRPSQRLAAVLAAVGLWVGVCGWVLATS